MLVLFQTVFAVPLIHYFAFAVSQRSAPCKKMTALHKHRTLRIGDHIGAVHLHQVWLDEKSCLTRA